jgi:hypothetical protein
MPNRKKQNAGIEAGASVDLAGGLEATNPNTQAKSSTDSDLLRSKSTSTDMQLSKLLVLLRQGPKTTIELRQHAIMMPAARVFQLRHELNFTIDTELVALYDPEGVRHLKCARYCLVEHTPAQGSLDLREAV